VQNLIEQMDARAAVRQAESSPVRPRGPR
jgi:hypothetical protein